MNFIFACLILLSYVVFIGAKSTNHDDHSAKKDSGEDEKKTYYPHWSYHGKHGPDHWGELEDNCAPTHHRQSPINIEKPKSKYDKDLKDIQLTDTTEDRPKTAHIVNNGHTVVVSTTKDYFLSGGSLGSMYKVAGFHFHWGSHSTKGSEHTIDGNAFPLEMHIVTYDAERFSNVGEALNGEDSLAVLGVLFKISRKDNEKFNPIIKSLAEVKYPDNNNKATLEVNLFDLLPSETNRYYRYLGSLTTPGCFQSVVWTVFSEPQPISEWQLSQFRQLTEEQDDHGAYAALVDNWRPAQAMYFRVVLRSFMFDNEYSTITDTKVSASTEVHGGSHRTTTTIPILLASVLMALMAAWLH